jgi:hypothetical protein
VLNEVDMFSILRNSSINLLSNLFFIVYLEK